MSSDSHPITISSDSSSDDVPANPIMDDDSSHSTEIVSSIGSTPAFPLVMTDTETEPFEEGEVAPTPHVSPAHNPLLAPSPLPAPSSPSSSYFLRDPLPASDLPLKKRARFDIPTPPSTEPEPPARFELGESSRAAAARQPSIEALGARIDAQQTQIDSLTRRLEELSVDRIEPIAEEVEGLVLGRVCIDLSHQSIQHRQIEDREHITELRQEMPELFDRADMARDELQSQSQELSLARETIVTLQGQVGELRSLVDSLVTQVRDLQDRAGGAP